MGLFLDQNGLVTLWEKIKSVFAKKSDLDGKADVDDLNRKVSFGEILLTDNAHAQYNKLYISKLDNSLFAAHKRFVVTYKLYDTEGNYIKDLYPEDLFNCGYEEYRNNFKDGTYAELYIGIVSEDILQSTNKYIWTYGAGTVIISCYASWIPDTIEASTFNRNGSWVNREVKYNSRKKFFYRPNAAFTSGTLSSSSQPKNWTMRSQPCTFTILV